MLKIVIFRTRVLILTQFRPFSGSLSQPITVLQANLTKIWTQI